MTLSFKTFRYWVLGPIALAGLFGLLAWCSIMLTRGDGRVAAIWLPNALLVAVLLRSEGPGRLRFFPPAYAANVLAGMIAGDPVARALGTSLANSVEVGAIWLGMLLARYPRPDFANLRQLVTFSVIAGMICPLIGGSIGASVLVQTGAVTDLWVSTWLHWSLIDGLSMLIAAPTLLILYDAAKVWSRPTRAVLFEWAAVSGLSLIIFGAVFFQNSFPLLFLICPVILLSAFRLGMSGTALSIVWTAVIAMIATTFDAGPISLVRGSLADKLLMFRNGIAGRGWLGGQTATQQCVATSGRIQRHDPGKYAGRYFHQRCPGPLGISKSGLDQAHRSVGRRIARSTQSRVIARR